MINPWDSYKNALLEGDEFTHLKNGTNINEMTSLCGNI